MRCPHCNHRIVQKSLDGKVKIRTPIVAFTANGAEVVCKGCGKDVPIDLVLGDGLRKSLAMAPAMLVVKIVDTVKPHK